MPSAVRHYLHEGKMKCFINQAIFLGGLSLPSHAAVTVCAPPYDKRKGNARLPDGHPKRRRMDFTSESNKPTGNWIVVILRMYVSNLPWDDALMIITIILERSRRGQQEKRNAPCSLARPAGQKKVGTGKTDGRRRPQAKMDAISAVMSPGK